MSTLFFSEIKVRTFAFLMSFWDRMVATREGSKESEPQGITLIRSPHQAASESA